MRLLAVALLLNIDSRAETRLDPLAAAIAQNRRNTQSEREEQRALVKMHTHLARLRVREQRAQRLIYTHKRMHANTHIIRVYIQTLTVARSATRMPFLQRPHGYYYYAVYTCLKICICVRERARLLFLRSTNCTPR